MCKWSLALWLFVAAVSSGQAGEASNTPRMQIATATEQQGSLPDRLAIRTLLLDRNFAGLEALLADHQAQYAAGHAAYWNLLIAYDAFSTSDKNLGPLLDEWVERMPDSHAALTARGLFLVHLGWLHRGSDYIQETPPDRIAKMEGMFDEAGPDLEAALAREPLQVAAFNGLLLINMALGRTAENERLFQNAFEQLPRRADAALLYMGTLSPAWSGSNAAVAGLLQSLVGHVSEAEFHRLEGLMFIMLGNELARSGEYEAAVGMFDQAIERGDVANWARGVRAESRLALDDLEGAREDLELVLGRDPQFQSAIITMARVLFRLGKRDQALEYIDRVLALDPLDPIALTARGRVHAGLRDFETADQDLANASIFRIPEADDLVQMSMISFRLEKLEDAILDIAKAVRLKPDRQEFWDHYETVAQSVALSCGDAVLLESFLDDCRMLGPCTAGDAKRWEARIERSRTGNC